MVEQIGMGAANPSRYGFECDSLWPRFDEQFPRGIQRHLAGCRMGQAFWGNRHRGGFSCD
jgi:hypothetical protein